MSGIPPMAGIPPMLYGRGQFSRPPVGGGIFSALPPAPGMHSIAYRAVGVSGRGAFCSAARLVPRRARPSCLGGASPPP